MWASNGGNGWRVEEDGRVIAQRKPTTSRVVAVAYTDGYEYRTRGEPLSMLSCLRDYGLEIAEASALTGVLDVNIAATIGIEAARGSGYHYDPVSLRHEPGYVDAVQTPRKISAGLMQTLLSTARMYNESELYVERFGDARIEVDDLCIPRRSILLGVMHMARLRVRYEDPVKSYVGAYNAGGVYSSDNEWNLRTYSPSRVDRWMAYVNDAIAAKGML